ncbi:MAG: LysM peptidoglycan-binding domain-containing M23 family metallopeptidase [Hydrogenovibrio sp.]|nr:LysM peptidoglycan-binding domain-containing M23 family metallopeptidase [Hydrogenovibrio sp.]
MKVLTPSILILFSLAVASLTGCAPAKYRGWDGGDQYFDQQGSRITRESKTSRSSNDSCHSPYIVRSGDTLSGIAQRCGVNMLELADLNHLSPPYWLDVNQQLRLPHAHSVKPKHHPAVIKLSKSSLFSWPMNKPYDYDFVKDGAGNNILVIKAPVGEAIYAVADGEVVYSGSGIEHYGRLVIIKHPTGYLTIYAHNDSLVVREGQAVKKGDLIATVGSTGDVKEPQLFFEARYHGRKVDAKPLFDGKFGRK